MLCPLCRALEMDSCSYFFFKLASTSLEALSCTPESLGLPNEPELTRIIQLTALTKLELGFFDHFQSLDPLHSLQLKEVRLINCFSEDWPTIGGSAFPFLQKLHISDDIEISCPGEGVRERKLDQLGSSLCSMPHLVSLSGNGVLLAVARIGALHPAWKLSPSSQHASSGIYTWERFDFPAS